MPIKYINWTGKVLENIDGVYKKTNDDFELSTTINRLEQAATNEANRLCGNLVMNGKCLIPNDLKKMTPEELENIYIYFGNMGIEKIFYDEQNYELIIECNFNTQHTSACTSFVILEKLELIEKTINPQKMQLTILHAAGTRTGLMIVEKIIPKIYPWADVQEKITERSGGA